MRNEPPELRWVHERWLSEMSSVSTLPLLQSPFLRLGFLSWRCGSSGVTRTLTKFCFTNFSRHQRSGAALHIFAETEIDRAVVAQDSAINRRLAPDRDIGIPMQHLVASRYWGNCIRATGTHHVEGRKRHPTYSRSGERLHSAWEHADQTADQLPDWAARARLRNPSLVYRCRQLLRRVNTKRNGDRNQRDVVPRIRRTIAAAQIDGNHDANQPPLYAIAMVFRVVSNGRSHQREQDIIDAGSAGVPYGLYFCQRNLRPGELLWPAVNDVKA